MPRPPKRYSDHNLSAALAAVKDGMAKRKAACMFNIPSATLKYRVKKVAIRTSIEEATTMQEKTDQLSSYPNVKHVTNTVEVEQITMKTAASGDTKTLRKDLCRVCLKSVSEVIELIPFDVDLMQQYNTLTNLTVKLMDGLPQHLCQECADTICECMEFIKNCTIVEMSLQLRCGKEMNPEHERSPTSPADTSYVNENANELEIKQEIKTEEYIIEDYYEASDAEMNPQNSFEDKSPSVRKSSRTKRKMSALAESVEPKTIKKSKRQSTKLEPGLMSCGICKETAINEETLKDHLKTHMNDDGCKCHLCSEEFDRWPTLFVHRFTHIDRKNSDFPCHLCSKPCKSPLCMEYHYLNTHYEGKQKGLKCKICFNYYSTVKKMKRHRTYHNTQTKIDCEFCPKTFYQKQCYVAHLQTHDDSRKYTCDTCHNVYKTRSALLVHIKALHTGLEKCYNCKRFCGKQEDYETHLVKCLAATLRVCITCGKKVKNRYLKRHMRSHEAEPAFKCSLCPKSFRNENNFGVHMDKHKGNKRFHCEFCEFRCYARNVLIKHRRIHTGEKPFVCEICAKGFTGRHNLKVHMKVHGIDAFAKRDEIE